MAQVGRAEITGTDIARRLGVEKAYGNKTADRGTALASLIHDALESDVAAAHSVGPTKEEIATFRKYVDENSRSPELLAEVKKVFGEDGGSYERLYLAPRIVNRKLHYFYSRDPLLHKGERALIEKAYGLAASGKALKDVAAELGLEYRNPKGEEKQDVPPALARHITAEEWRSNDPLVPIVEKLTDGQLYDNIIEDDLGYQVFRLLEKGKGKERYFAEAAVARKRPFDEWFREEAAKIKIRILDPELKKKIKAAYANVWWVKQATRR